MTSIVDLGDGRHIATGSYDKKVNIFSLSKNQKVVNLNNRTSVTAMVLSADQNRLVTAGLDKTLSVWVLSRKNGVFIQLFRTYRMSFPNEQYLTKNSSVKCSPLS